MSYHAGRAKDLRIDSVALGQTQEWTVVHRGMEYPGEVIVAEKVDPQWGRRLEGPACFRVVLYTVPRRIPAGQIQDPRIAMAVPRRSLQPWRQSLGQEIESIHEARERYVTRQDADTQAVRSSMQEREISLRDELVRRQALSYAEGRIYTAQGVGLTASAIFAGASLSSSVDSVVGATMEQAYPTLPFEHRRLPDAVTHKNIGDIFAGVVQQNPDFADASRFGPALGIATGPTPGAFDASESRVMGVIAAALGSSGGETQTRDLVQLLCRDYGLNPILATFYLLAFVRHAGAEIGLSPGHSIELRSGDPLLSDRITSDMVAELSFTASTGEVLGTLRRRPAPVWNAVLPYASLIVEGLGLSDDSAEIEKQARRLISGLTDIGTRLKDSIDTISELATALDEEAGDALGTLRRLQVLCSASGFQGFRDTVVESFGGPSGLREALQLRERLERLAALAPAVVLERRYLADMTFGRRHQDLALQRDAAVKTMGLDGLIDSPSLWGSIEQNIRQLRNGYSASYLSHHAGYHREAAEILRDLEPLPRQIEALERFNDVPEFEGTVDTDAPARFRDLTASIRTCVEAEDDIDLESVPVCNECHLPMDEDAPRRVAAMVIRDTSAAMREYNQRISSEGVRRILADPSREQLDTFIDMVQISEISDLANVLDADVLEFLRRFVRNG